MVTVKKIQIPTLLALIGGAGIGIGIAGIVYHRACEKSIARSKFLHEAIEEMAKHKEIIDLLGGEYKVGTVDYSDGWTRLQKEKIRIRLPIAGTKRNANLLIYAQDIKFSKSPYINRLEMMFDKIDGKTLLILDRPTPKKPDRPEKLYI